MDADGEGRGGGGPLFFTRMPATKAEGLERTRGAAIGHNYIDAVGWVAASVVLAADREVGRAAWARLPRAADFKTSGITSHGLYGYGLHPGQQTSHIRHYILMAYVVMGYAVMAYIVVVYTVITYATMTYIVMVYIIMAYIVMAYVVMAYVVMAYVVMA